MDSKQYQELSEQIGKISKTIQNIDRKSPDPEDREDTFESIVEGNDIMIGLRKGSAVVDVSSYVEGDTFETLANQIEL